MAVGSSARPLWIVGVEAASVLAFAASWTLVCLRAAQMVGSADLFWMLPLALAAGYVAADALSGGVHWLADSYFDEHTPILGRLLIEPFREHHRDPAAITRHDLLEVSGNNCLATLPAAAGILVFDASFETRTSQLLGLCTVSAALALAATNWIHRWAHVGEPPLLVGWLQRRRLILAPGAHARHHCADHTAGYCVTSGWLNPLFDRLDLFRRIESLLVRLGAPPPAHRAPRRAPAVPSDLA